MGASASGMKAAEQPAAESLLTAFKTLSAAERRRHASVLNYWLSVRGDKEFPPLHDLDPLELSDAGPSSILMELISGGHDAEIKHLGEALREEAWPERIIDAPNPSVLACIAKKLPIVAISRDFLAFEDEYEGAGGKTRCSVTLLPLSAGGAWVDYVYALVSVDSAPAKSKSSDSGKKTKSSDSGPAPASSADEPEATLPDETSFEQPGAEHPPVEAVAEDEPLDAAPASQAADTDPPETQELPEPTGEPAELDQPTEAAPETPAPAPGRATPGFSKLLDSLAGLTGFYGSQPVKVEPVVERADAAAEAVAEPADMHAEEEAVDNPPADQAVSAEPVPAEPAEAEITGHVEPEQEVGEQESEADDCAAEEPVGSAVPDPAEDVVAQEPAVPERAQASENDTARLKLEGSLQDKLTEVRSKTDEARLARLRANAALYEGLAAAYDFALDAEEAPEEYLRLVEAQGLKIQLRSPMKPVVKLAFAGMCDEATIKQLEAVLAWAFDEELPRGTLAERIEAAGGIGAILNPDKKAA